MSSMIQGADNNPAQNIEQANAVQAPNTTISTQKALAITAIVVGVVAVLAAAFAAIAVFAPGTAIGAALIGTIGHAGSMAILIGGAVIGAALIGVGAYYLTKKTVGEQAQAEEKLLAATTSFKEKLEATNEATKDLETLDVAGQTKAAVALTEAKKAALELIQEYVGYATTFQGPVTEDVANQYNMAQTMVESLVDNEKFANFFDAADKLVAAAEKKDAVQADVDAAAASFIAAFKAKNEEAPAPESAQVKANNAFIAAMKSEEEAFAEEMKTLEQQKEVAKALTQVKTAAEQLVNATKDQEVDPTVVENVEAAQRILAAIANKAEYTLYFDTAAALNAAVAQGDAEAINLASTAFVFAYVKKNNASE